MRRRHETERGVICEHCNRHVFKGEYIRINHLVPIIADTTGKYESVGRYNLCNRCYSEYAEFMNRFCIFGKNKH